MKKFVILIGILLLCGILWVIVGRQPSTTRGTVPETGDQNLSTNTDGVKNGAHKEANPRSAETKSTAKQAEGGQPQTGRKPVTGRGTPPSGRTQAENATVQNGVQSLQDPETAVKGSKAKAGEIPQTRSTATSSTQANSRGPSGRSSSPQPSSSPSSSSSSSPSSSGTAKTDSGLNTQGIRSIDPAILVPQAPPMTEAEAIVASGPLRGEASLTKWVTGPDGRLKTADGKATDVSDWMVDQTRNHVSNQVVRLREEQDPELRQALIENITKHYSEADTLGSLDWAMGLTDETEREMAVERISKNIITGVGVTLARSESGLPLVGSVLNTSNAKNRLRAGDQLQGIHDEQGAFHDFKEREMKDVVSRVRGQAGSMAKLRILRDGVSMDVEVERRTLVRSPGDTSSRVLTE